jgi:starch synthase (maltosyl-transferring)
MRRIYQATREDLGTNGNKVDVFEHGARLGFDSLCVRPRDFNLFSPEFSEKTFSPILSMARHRGISVLIDLRIDVIHLGAQKEILEDVASLRSSYLDPRQAPSGSPFIPVDFDDWDMGSAAPSRRWIDRLAGRLEQLVDMGVGGFRCVEISAAPSRAWRELIEKLRGLRPGRVQWHGDVSRSAHGSENPGFDAVIVPMESLSDPDFRVPAGCAVIAAVAASSARRPVAAGSEDPFTLCAGLGDGIFYAARGRSRLGPAAAADPSLDEIGLTRINGFLARQYVGTAELGTRHVTVHGPSVRAISRYFREKDSGQRSILLSVVNKSREDIVVDLAALGHRVGPFLPLQDPFDSHRRLSPMLLKLRAGESRVLTGGESAPIIVPGHDLSRSAQDAVAAPRLAIEAVEPSVEGGYAVKRTVGETVRVEADAFGEGHDAIVVALKWKAVDETEWKETEMRSLGNDRWVAEFPLTRLGRHHFTIAAWRDEFAIYHDQLAKKFDAGVSTPLDVEEGRRLIAKLARSDVGNESVRMVADISERLRQAGDSHATAILLDPSTLAAAARAGTRPFFTEFGREITVDAESPQAAFASWYQLFPRSQSGDANRHGTFDDVIRRLPKIQEMGFDVVYMPPIHPIGTKNRKGRDNSLRAEPNDPGSPYAIGSTLGGHDAIHPELGDLAAFNRLVEAARDLDMEIALDLAIQASPDHPWLREHPEWFDWRPDGSIRYAENPPKKYEDIVNVDFYTPGAKPALWKELRDIVLLWARRGVRLFRVDNPHTKPFPFWEWLIDDIRREYPKVVFLSEAFTRPKVMNKLAKIGFSQSYTYFTWRNTKYELTEYMNELVNSPAHDYFRPHFFVNTHDINPDFLQNAPRSAYLIRAALATTLSGLWGMYNGFELCEGRPDAKKKEYASSEKYQITAWDWDRPGNIIAEITALNTLRRQNPALQSHLGLEFHLAGNENILYFEKATPNRDNVILVAISLDPRHVQEADIEVPLWNFGLPDNASLTVEDLMRGSQFGWTGKMQRIRLDPAEMPFSIWRLSRGS